MAFTTDQLDRLEEAIASGALRVSYADKEVIYQSMDDMIKARNLIRRALGITAAGSGRSYVSTSKGTDAPVSGLEFDEKLD